MQHTEIRIVRTGDPPAFPEIVRERSKVTEISLDRCAILQSGTQGGKTSVAFLCDMPDGTLAFIQVTGAMLAGIAAAMKGAMASWGEDWPGV